MEKALQASTLKQSDELQNFITEKSVLGVEQGI